MVECTNLSEHAGRTNSSFYCTYNNYDMVLHFNVHNGFHEEKEDIMGGSSGLL